MDSQSIISIIQGLLVFVVLLVFVNLYLVVRLKDIDPFKSWNRNLLNGGLFMVFFISGVALATVSMVKWYPKMILLHNPASEHGVALDSMMWNTIWVTFLVVIVTNSLLFWFSWKYRGVEGRKGLYYPHNNRLEYLWTGVPAIVMTLLVGKGIIVWNDITMGDPKPGEISIEVVGKQFDWTYRYPGADGQFGETKVGFIKPGKFKLRIHHGKAIRHCPVITPHINNLCTIRQKQVRRRKPRLTDNLRLNILEQKIALLAIILGFDVGVRFSHILFYLPKIR